VTGAARPFVFAHRGSSADAPENTLAAFARARADGADGVELDVMQCASGELVVFHDDDLERLCGVPGMVREQSWAQLRALSVRGEPIPLLDEVIETVGAELVINVELKAKPGLRARVLDDGLAAAVAVGLRRHENASARFLVSSFDPVLLARFSVRMPELETALLFAADQALPLRRGWPARLLRTPGVHPEAALVNERSVIAWRRRGLAVRVWTVDDADELRYLASLGVDAVITNRPRDTLRVLGEDRTQAPSQREAS
jgi:glycerophosphoryl diester phosphodiesterase